MEPLKNEPATNTTVEQRPIPPGQRLEALKQNPEPIIKKTEAVSINKPLTKEAKERRLYWGGISTAIVISIVALFVAINANHGRVDQTALVDAFAGALAKNSADRLQNSNVGVPTQPNSMNNGQNSGQNTESTGPQGTNNSGNGGFNSNGNGNSNNMNTNPNGNNTTSGRGD